jgi:2-polyprenyl-3-methyl-5-hydroxy-6-metoxy-1,4-benzoquinol methylase
MDDDSSLEIKKWEEVKERLPEHTLRLGGHWSYNLWNDPKRLAFVLSRYKFAAKMGCKDMAVCELGCSEGIGTPILAEFARTYVGVDMDADAIISANRNWSHEKVSFVEADFIGKSFGTFNTVVSLDVVEHIKPSYEALFFDTLSLNLSDDGITIIGTPNSTSAHYASAASMEGHVNLFDGKRLCAALNRLFHTVFLFSGNDEIIHTGYTPMAHYLLAIGCDRK